jgi:hypothetical protein
MEIKCITKEDYLESIKCTTLVQIDSDKQITTSVNKTISFQTDLGFHKKIIINII